MKAAYYTLVIVLSALFVAGFVKIIYEIVTNPYQFK